jgi:L-2,4-diaminobutyric acid acetyltransferase
VLLCTHFAAGSLVAVRDGELVGCVLGYRPPTRPDAMFVWQIGVHADARGCGLATELLARFSELPIYRECRFLEATVGTSNQASRALFRGFARERDAPCEEGPGFPAALFAAKSHEDEDLFRIGPLRS